MAAFIKGIIAVIVAMVLQAGMTGATETSPAEEAEEFMKGMSTLQEETLNKYMGNQYVNFLVNVEGDEETVARMRTTLLKNFTYKISEIEERDGLAVAEIPVSGNDFSEVMKDYEEEAYDYITENLYDEDITDREALSEKCLEIYVEQLEEEAEEGDLTERTIYLPMKETEHHSWDILLDDDIMQTMLGDVALPEGVLEGEGK